MKICFLGFGRRAKTLYGHIIQLPEVKVVGIYDPVEATTLPAEYYTNPRRMLSACHPDLVIDATPPSRRLRNILLCNSFKIPIICEKPLLFSAAELKRLRNVSINIYPAYQLSYDPFIRKSFSLVDRINHVMLRQRIRLVNPGWRSAPGILGGALADNGIHLIHLAVKYFGMPQKVFATSSSKDISAISDVQGILWYKNFTVEFSADWRSAVGKETIVQLNTPTKDVYFEETNEYKGLRTVATEGDGEWINFVEERWFPAKGIDRDIQKNPFNAGNSDATRAMLDAFLSDAAFVNKKPSKLAREEFNFAVKTSAVAKALYRSIKSGGSVSL